MTKMERKTQKIFAQNAPSNKLVQFGTPKTDTPVYSRDVGQIQNSVAYDEGWQEAVKANSAPYLEDLNSLQYAITRQLAYLYQNGMPEWDNETEYFKGQWCKGLNVESKNTIFESLTDNNLGNPVTDETKWLEVELGGGGSSLPLFTAMAFDRILTGDEAKGWAIQGSLVTMTYPQAVGKIVEEYANGADVTVRGIVCKRASNGHIIADISQKSAIDSLYASSGVAEFYVLDSVNERFYLPRNDWFVQGTSDPSKVNQFVEAGLPNISGKLGSNIPGDVGFCGELVANEQIDALSTYGTTNRTGYQGAGSNPYATGIEFNASRSNPIYGKSSTVQPPSSLKLVYYKVGDTVVNESLVDIGNVLSDLQLKADLDLGNINSEGKSFASGMGMPSGVRVHNILGAPGSSVPSRNYQTGVGSKLKYTPLANGYIGVSITARVYDNNISQGIVVTANDLVTIFAHFQYNFHTDSFYFPVKKGETYTFYIAYATGGNSTPGLLSESYFEYAQGEI